MMFVKILLVVVCCMVVTAEGYEYGNEDEALMETFRVPRELVAGKKALAAGRAMRAKSKSKGRSGPNKSNSKGRSSSKNSNQKQKGRNNLKPKPKGRGTKKGNNGRTLVGSGGRGIVLRASSV